MNWLSIIMGFFSGFFNTASRLLDFFKEKAYIEQGKALQQAEIAKKEAEIAKKQSAIISQERTREETIKRMEDGTF